MTVKLAERGVDAVVALLKSDLGTELGLINADRGDVATEIPPDDNYYKWPVAEISGGTVHVEVFESRFTFANPYLDSGAGRAVFDLPVTIRVTWFNRDADTVEEMYSRARRYAAGVFNVLAGTPTIDTSDSSVKIGEVTAVTPPWDVAGEGEGDGLKSQVVIEATVRCEES